MFLNKNNLILKVQENKIHLKLSNRKSRGQIPHKYYKKILKKGRNYSIDYESMLRKYAHKTPKICNLHKGMKRARCGEIFFFFFIFKFL